MSSAIALWTDGGTKFIEKLKPLSVRQTASWKWNASYGAYVTELSATWSFKDEIEEKSMVTMVIQMDNTTISATPAAGAVGDGFNVIEKFLHGGKVVKHMVDSIDQITIGKIPAFQSWGVTFEFMVMQSSVDFRMDIPIVATTYPLVQPIIIAMTAIITNKGLKEDVVDLCECIEWMGWDMVDPPLERGAAAT